MKKRTSFAMDSATIRRLFNEPSLRKPPLTQDEAASLLRLYRTTGEVCHRNRIIEGYRSLILWIATRMWKEGDDIADLFQEATIGFQRGIDKYDEAKGALNSYCSEWAKKGIREEIGAKNYRSVVKVPDRVQRAANRTNNKERVMINRLMQQLETTNIPIDLLVPEGEKETSVAIAGVAALRVVVTIDEERLGDSSTGDELRERFGAELDSLPTMDREVLLASYDTKDSLNAVLTKYSLSRDMANRIKGECIMILKERLSVTVGDNGLFP